VTGRRSRARLGPDEILSAIGAGATPETAPYEVSCDTDQATFMGVRPLIG